MGPEDAVLFACTRQDFRPADRERVLAAARSAAVDWELVAGTAERHGVAPLVGVNLRQCAAALPAGLPLAPPAITARLERAALENAAYKLREAGRLAAALRDLRAAGYEALLIKGAALDLLVYREPWFTVSRDIDLVVRPLPGRDPGEEGRAVRRALYLDGIECDLLTHHDVTMSDVLPVPFERIWRDARPVAVGGNAALAMAPEDLLLSLAVNACRKRYFRLKALLDLAEAVRVLAGGEPALDWTLVAQKARAWRCGGIAYAALAAADSTLGCGLRPGTLERLAAVAGPGRAQRRVIRRLLAALLGRGSIARGSLLGSSARGRLLGRSFEASLLLVYASLRPEQVVRSVRGAADHLPPELRPPGTAAPTPARPG